MRVHPEVEDLYPEVAAAGSLAAALDAGAVRHGLSLGFVRSPDTLALLTSAIVPSGVAVRNDLAVSGRRDQRRFDVQGWGEGIWLIAGGTGDLVDVVRAAHSWRAGVPLHDIRSAVPFVELTRRAEVVEQGPASVVEAEWQWLLRSTDETGSPNQRALIQAAYHDPRLRRLYPYTSNSVLNFSTTTGYPFSPSPVNLSAHGARSTFRVGRHVEILGETATAAEAVALAVAHIPADLGPAVAGKYEA
ncbi:DUF6193 family natural product biosynthesis protein [Asanoa sp. WMMD1127]|uniref:DUF6193 family natural product biosynthesis protein n=1 Tax=Asanoa sp. WMMD1127 TaxID=3016107 RepID=UPI002416857F|nr:DUF6193 family natural product biosynthesis protein [Asanoa sp. WMMD1127]MDG4824075.1 DUF6193 family natural product biosynthesis protein [Asanoa sp. WMMD1127]